MGKAMFIIDMPETCMGRYFRDKTEDIYVGDGLFKKVSKCRLSPDTIEDPYRDIFWQLSNKEDWCPFKPVPEKINVDIPHDTDYDMEYEYGWNACLDKILRKD